MIIPDDAALRRIFDETRTIALIGASPHQWRDSYMVMAFLQQQGFRVIPINPNVSGTTILGEPVLPDLTAVTVPVEMVNIFRNSEAAGEAIDTAIAAQAALGLRSIWLQLGIRNELAAERAVSSGLAVVMDCCIKIEYRRLRSIAAIRV